MKALLFSIGFVLITNSCTKDKSTNYFSYLENKTGHKIVIHPYVSGIVPPERILTLLPNTKLEIAHGTLDGLVTKGYISGYWGGDKDSIVVIYDDSVTITHYFVTPASLNRKYYLQSSNRNLANQGSYTFGVTVLSKYKWQTVSEYQFTEQDYLDAK